MPQAYLMPWTFALLQALACFIMDFALFSLISIETGIPQNARFRTFLYILVPPPRGAGWAGMPFDS